MVCTRVIPWVIVPISRYLLITSLILALFLYLKRVTENWIFRAEPGMTAALSAVRQLILILQNNIIRRFIPAQIQVQRLMLYNSLAHLIKLFRGHLEVSELLTISRISSC